MPTYIALLRGINVSGQKLIRMVDLQAHFASGGAASVRTYIQSGNVVFEHREPSATTLRRKLEIHLKARLGYAVPTLVKTVQELAAIVATNPYPASLPEFGKRMYVCFFEKAPTTTAIASIQPYVHDDERLMVKGLAGYAYYANGLGGARLSSAVIERRLGMATLRNWNTVTALLNLGEGETLAAPG